jgi:hypothetical protein
VSAALRHFLERAVELHGGTFEDWFPECFDWEALCEDAPPLAQRLGAPPREPDGEDRLRAAAAAAFQASHLAALAVLCAATEDGGDPAVLLDRLTRRLDEDEEEEVARLADERLGAIEEALGEGEGAAVPEDAEDALALARLAWAPVLAHLADALRDAGEGSEEEAAVLVGVARVGAILAAFRWRAAQVVNEDWPAVGGPDGAPLG